MPGTPLDDRAVREFITQGYTLVQADQPAEFHREVSKKLDATLDAEGNPGNNILPRVPELGAIFDSPSVRGALHSLLGPGYSMHPHRYCHLNRPGSQGQNWHKDDYVYDSNARHHRFRWLMAFYYPQDVDPEMGPTGIMPARQHYNHISDPDPAKASELEQKLCGPAGTVALVNFDVWHRATANTSNRKRHMLKFQFLRMQEPIEPNWQRTDEDWQQVAEDAHPGLSAHIWHWLAGAPATNARSVDDAAALISILQNDDEKQCIDTAYALGHLGDCAVPALIDALRLEALAKAESKQAKAPANVQGGNPADLDTAHALSAIGPAAVPALIEELASADWPLRSAAADILGNLGLESRTATPALNRALTDENRWVRRNAAEALGTISPENEESAALLAKALKDGDEQVRRNAALALAKIGPAAASAVSALRASLADENRYTRFNALLALQRIGTPTALDALWNDVHTARWCPITNKETPY